MDYGSGPYTIIFTAGTTSVVFNISLNDDNAIEGNENFMLAISSSTLPSDFTVGNPNQATVTVVDNDGMLIVV